MKGGFSLDQNKRASALSSARVSHAGQSRTYGGPFCRSMGRQIQESKTNQGSGHYRYFCLHLLSKNFNAFLLRYSQRILFFRGKWWLAHAPSAHGGMKANLRRRNPNNGESQRLRCGIRGVERRNAQSLLANKLFGAVSGADSRVVCVD